MKKDIEMEMLEYEKRNKEVARKLWEEHGLMPFIIPLAPWLTIISFVAFVGFPFSDYSLIPFLSGLYFAWVWYLNRKTINRI